jgi:tRNA(Arg) A34 adenosine deaminase TadA
MVKIVFNLSLIDKIGKKEMMLETASSLKLTEFIIQLGIGVDEVGMVVADGRWRNIEDVRLMDHAVIDVFPHLEGG